jgi:hypothetical protein
MKQESDKTTVPAVEANKPSLIWGGFIIDILKKLLEYNQMVSGIKKKF